jgi:hypothetical protein
MSYLPLNNNSIYFQSKEKNLFDNYVNDTFQLFKFT